MKWVGFLMILSGCIGIGYSYINEYRGRIDALSNIRNMMHYIQEMITLEKLPLSEAIARTAQRMEESYKDFLEEVARQLDIFSPEELVTIWQTQGRQMKKVLGGKDLEEFLHCMDQSGFASAASQGAVIRQYESELSKRVTALTREREEKCKLYRSLGILSGIFICVLLF